MNAFSTVSIRAAEKLLQTQDASYYASDIFRRRTEFSEPGAQSDQLLVVNYLLTRCALDPRPTSMTGLHADLARGVVMLKFFGVSNPVPFFELAQGSPELARLRVAVRANLASPMNAAAQRVMKWRNAEKSNLRRKHEDAVMGRLRESLAFPTRDDHDRNAAAAEQTRSELYKQLGAKLKTVRDRRNARLARLSAAAAPGLTSWTALLEDISLHALKPVH